jgi:serine/threonine-protein phosphatase PP1 catalytic subunit
MPNISELNLSHENEKCIVVGDLHGHFQDLLIIIDKLGIPGKDSLQFIIFNGDFIDRGDAQIETLLTILYSFNLNPNRFFLNRGNHEDRVLNSQPIYKPCLKLATLKYFCKYGSVVF